MASRAPTRAVAGRAAIQPNRTNIGMSAAINISMVGNPWQYAKYVDSIQCQRR